MMKKKLTNLIKGKKDSIYIKSIENSSSYKDSDGITHTISSFTIELLFEDNYNGIKSGKDKMKDFFPTLKDHINIIDKRISIYMNEYNIVINFPNECKDKYYLILDNILDIIREVKKKDITIKNIVKKEILKEYTI